MPGGHSGILLKSVRRTVLNILGQCRLAGRVGWGVGVCLCVWDPSAACCSGVCCNSGGLSLRHPLSLHSAVPHCHLVVLVALRVKQKCAQREAGTSTAIRQVVRPCVASNAYVGWDLKPMHRGFSRLNEG